MPAIPYLVPEFVSVAAKTSVPHSGVHFPLFFFGFAHNRIFRFFCVFRLFHLFQFSRVQIRNSGFSVFSVFSAFSGFEGSKSGIPVFPFFPLLGAPNLEFRGHASGHVWCGHVWRAPTNVEEKQIHETTSVKRPSPDDKSQPQIKEERKEEGVTPKSEAATVGTKDEPAEPDSEDSLRPEQIVEELRRLIAEFPPSADSAPGN